MKRALVIITILVLTIVSVQAQIIDFDEYKKKTEAEFKQYSDSVWNAFSEFRQRANEEYAQFMREQWKSFTAFQEEQRPTLLEPPIPIVRDNDVSVPNLPIRVPVNPVVVPDPMPIDPVVIPDIPKPSPMPKVNTFDFVCYGTPCTVHFDNSLKIKLRNNNENSVADAWEVLSTEFGEILLEDCLRLRREMALGDWAYYCLVRDLSDGIFGKDSEEAKVMQAYLLAQSGYDFRIGRQNNRLVLLMPFDGDILCWENAPQSMSHFITINSTKFYIINRLASGHVDVFDHKFSDNDRVFSLRMSCPPKFASRPANVRTLASSRYPELNVKLSVNKNLMDFYAEYPSCYWDNYAWAGLSDGVKAKLYPVLRAGIRGKSQIESANRLINFVQTAFEYKRDDDQFGYERALFADETLYYPFSDCEDRSILFSTLVRDLLGLDVILLNYHDHLATAVCYTENLSGYYFVIDGKTYYISDPTYIGANVGMCMPGYEKESPRIFKL